MKNRGGEAFPGLIPHKMSDGSHRCENTAGMSLRDWFAGMAMMGIRANMGKSCEAKALARWAYEDATAMLNFVLIEKNDELRERQEKIKAGEDAG